MTTFLIYIIKWAVCLTLLYSLYGLLLRRETFHGINRGVLFSILVLSMLLPLANFGWLGGNVFSRQVSDLETTLADSATGYSAVVRIVAFVYIICAAVGLLGYLLSLLLVVLTVRRSELVEKRGRARILVNRRLETACSWMCWILMKNPVETESDRMTCEHEYAHVRMQHSWDKMLSEVTARLLFFLPFGWMLRNDLRDVQEYQADLYVLSQGEDELSYQRLLIRNAAAASPLKAANSFADSPIKRRLLMMYTKPSTSRAALKAAYLLPLLFFVVCAFAKPTIVSDVTAVIEQEAKVAPLLSPTALIESVSPTPALPREREREAESLSQELTTSFEDIPETFVEEATESVELPSVHPANTSYAMTDDEMDSKEGVSYAPVNAAKNNVPKEMVKKMLETLDNFTPNKRQKAMTLLDSQSETDRRHPLYGHWRYIGTATPYFPIDQILSEYRAGKCYVVIKQAMALSKDFCLASNGSALPVIYDKDDQFHASLKFNGSLYADDVICTNTTQDDCKGVWVRDNAPGTFLQKLDKVAEKNNRTMSEEFAHRTNPTLPETEISRRTQPHMERLHALEWERKHGEAIALVDSLLKIAPEDIALLKLLYNYSRSLKDTVRAIETQRRLRAAAAKRISTEKHPALMRVHYTATDELDGREAATREMRQFATMLTNKYDSVEMISQAMACEAKLRGEVYYWQSKSGSLRTEERVRQRLMLEQNKAFLGSSHDWEVHYLDSVAAFHADDPEVLSALTWHYIRLEETGRARELQQKAFELYYPQLKKYPNPNNLDECCVSAYGKLFIPMAKYEFDKRITETIIDPSRRYLRQSNLSNALKYLLENNAY